MLEQYTPAKADPILGLGKLFAETVTVLCETGQ